MADSRQVIQLAIEYDQATGQATVKSVDGISHSLQDLGKNADNAQEKVKQSGENQFAIWTKLKGALAGLAAIGTGRAVLMTADDMRILNARIDYMTQSSGDARDVWNEIYRISQRNSQLTDDTVTLFQRLQIAADRLGASNKDVLKVAEAVQALGRESGSSSEEIKSASIQLGQALQAPKAQWEEFAIILDSAPGIIKQIEKSLKLVPGGLKQAIAAGLDTQKIFDALVKSSDEIVKRTEKLPTSIGSSVIALKNALTNASEAADEAAGGITKRWSDGVQEIARLVDTVTGRFRKAYVPSDLGIDPKLSGQERANALMERYTQLTKDASDAEERLRKLNPIAGIRPGANKEAISAQSALIGLRREIQAVEQAILEANGQILLAAKGTDELAKNAKATQSAIASANSTYADANGFQKLKDDVKSTSDAVKEMNQSLGMPAPKPTVSQQLQDIIALSDQARASIETGDMATALARIQEGARAIQSFVSAGGIADGTIGSLALEFERMSEAARIGARDGKDALDAIARAMNVPLTVTPKLDESKLDEIVSKMRRAIEISPEDLAQAGLIGAEKARGAFQQSMSAKPVVIEKIDVSAAASVAGQTVVGAIHAAIAGASFVVPVRAVVTVDAGGATQTAGQPIERAAAKTGTRTQ